MGRIAVLFLVAASCTPSRARRVEGPAANLVITGATLIDGTGAPPRPGTTIAIQGDRIAAIAPDGARGIPSDAAVIDAAGKYVIPGIVDAHAHGTSDAVLGQYLFYGVTSVLQMGGTGASTDDIRSLRERRAAGTLEAPYIYGTGGHLTLHGTHPIYTIFPPEVRDAADALAEATPLDEPVDLYPLGIGLSFVRSADAARKAVRERAAGGMDAIKITVETGPFGPARPLMSEELVRAIVEAATQEGLPVFAHVTSVDELENALYGGVSTLAHGVPLDARPEHLRLLLERGVSITPTLALGHAFYAYLDDPALLDDPFLRAGVSEEAIEEASRSVVFQVEGMSDRARHMHPDVIRRVGEVHRAGVTIALGTDAPNAFVFPGFSAHVEMELLAEAGLRPMEVLQAATRNGAELLGLGDEFGTVEAGKRADLLVLGANPLDDIRNTRSLEVIVSSGRVVDREALLRDVVEPGQAGGPP